MISLFGCENLLGPSKLSLQGKTTYALSVSANDSGSDLGGPFFVLWFGLRGFLLLSKESWTPLQKYINLPFIR